VTGEASGLQEGGPCQRATTSLSFRVDQRRQRTRHSLLCSVNIAPSHSNLTIARDDGEVHSPHLVTYITVYWGARIRAAPCTGLRFTNKADASRPGQSIISITEILVHIEELI